MSTRRTSEVEPKRGVLADAIVEKIRHVARTRVLDLALEIGEIVAHGVYEGSLEQLRARGEDDPLYRMVAAHEKLPFQPRTLSTYVRVYELLHRFPGMKSSKHVGLAHFRAVLGLAAPVQERLLVRAEKEGWQSERLESEAAHHRPTPSNRGRPPTGVFLRQVFRVERLTAELAEDLGPRVEGRLDPEKLARVTAAIEHARAKLEALDARVRKMATERKSD